MRPPQGRLALAAPGFTNELGHLVLDQLVRGKTTTIAKLAHRFHRQQKHVLVGAYDRVATMAERISHSRVSRSSSRRGRNSPTSFLRLLRSRSS